MCDRNHRIWVLASLFLLSFVPNLAASALQTVTANEQGKPPDSSVTLTQPQPSFRQRLQAGEPAAVSAVGTWFGAFCAASIGILAFRLNRNIRRGQAAHEQIRMLLEIDTELIKSPELWAVHGADFIPTHTGPEGPSVLIAELKESATALVKSAEAAVPLAKTEQGQLALAKLVESITGLAKMADRAAAYAKIWEALPVASNPSVDGVVQGGTRTSEQLRLLALLMRLLQHVRFCLCFVGSEMGPLG